MRGGTLVADSAMPDQSSWLERVPEILAWLKAADSPPFLDRPSPELLFGVKRRQAIELMHRMAGYQVGKTFLVEQLGQRPDGV